MKVLGTKSKRSAKLEQEATKWIRDRESDRTSGFKASEESTRQWYLWFGFYVWGCLFIWLCIVHVADLQYVSFVLSLSLCSTVFFSFTWRLLESHYVLIIVLKISFKTIFSACYTFGLLTQLWKQKYKT